MSERYSKVFALSENLYATDSPIIIEAGALQKDNQTGGILAQIKMKNISAKVIKAVKVKLTLFDVAGNILADGVEQQYLDLRVVRDESFGSKSAIKLKESTTRSFAVNIIEVVFEDGSVWNGTANPWEALSNQTALINYFNDEELVKQFELTYGAPCHNVLLEEKDLWHCTCGATNKNSEEKCHKCGKSLKALKELDIPALKSEKEKRLEAERLAAEEQAERERKEAEIAEIESAVRKKRKIKSLKITALILCVVAICCIGGYWAYNNIIIPNGRYNDAVNLMNNGNYEEAIVSFKNLDGYKDSEVQIEACNYALNDIKYNDAVTLMTIGKYEEAAAAFKKIENHKDSIEQIEACNYALNDIKYNDAIALMNGSEYYKAISIFESIVNHKDSAQLVNDLKELKYNEAISLMRDEKYESAILIFETIKDYKDSKSQLMSSMKTLAAFYEEKEVYLSAVKYYEQLGDRESVNRCKYSYIQNNKDSSNTTTYEYLSALKNINYKDAADIYDSYYKESAKVFFNKTQKDSTTSLTTYNYNANSNLYCHYEIKGLPNQKIKVRIVHEKRSKMLGSLLPYELVEEIESTAIVGEDNIYVMKNLSAFNHRVVVYNAETGRLLGQATLQRES